MKNIFKRTLALVFATVALSACLKDDSTVLDPEKAGGNIIEFMNPAEIAIHGSTTALYVLSYPIVNTETIVPISVAYVGAENGAPQDITVNIGLDNQALIDQYNTENSKSYEFMPAAWYSIKSTSVVIPKGAKSASFNIGIRTSLFDLTKSFAVPVKITSASSGIVSTNFSRVLLAFGAKNPYDGLYRYQTSANTALVANADKPNISLVTTGPNSVAIKPGLLATYSNAVTYTIDPATNQVTVTAALGSGAVTPPDSRSKWDPATKTLKVYWAQIASPRIFEETFTYTGVRP